MADRPLIDWLTAVSRFGAELDPVAFIFQPVFRFAPARTAPLHVFPEARGVIAMPQVADLVSNNVVDNIKRRQHDTGIILDTPLASAMAPFRARKSIAEIAKPVAEVQGL